MQDLIKLVKHFEGCRLETYKCPAGYLTIGWGTTDGVTKGMKISQFMADYLLERQLDELAGKIYLLTAYSIDRYKVWALASFAYNVGLGALKKSTLLKKVMAKAPPEEITKQFMRWTKAGGKELPGLVRRRKAEAELFNTGGVVLT